jgi:hypothetical protein
MRRIGTRLACAVAISVVSLSVAAAGPAVAADSNAQTCSGTPSSPGVLAGNYPGDVVIDGACVVNGGAAIVQGNLTLSPHSTLLAIYALNDQTGTGSSSLTVRRDLDVRRGATLFMGCDPQSSPCADDPDQNNPTLSSRGRVLGNLNAQHALALILHNVRIAGDVTDDQGGGGVNCRPHGIFKEFGSPAFSTIEDASIGGDVLITGVQSCWMGFNRVHSRGNVTFTNNQLADPDAIEILSNHIDGNLACHNNSRVWDNSDVGEDLFPRDPQPNSVQGERKGQCVLSSPNTEDDQPGPGPF